MDGELGFDLKALGKHGERFDKGAAHGAIARHDVIEAVSVDPFDHGANQIVAKAVEGALVFLGVGAVGQAIADGHIGCTIKNGLAEGFCRFGRVGVVAVDHEVTIGIDIAEHLTADIAFSLARLKTHRGAVFRCDARGIV